jgi:hypothetical protein
VKPPESTKEHEWLLKLLGDWTFEHDAPPVDGEPPGKIRGTETFRSIGVTWVHGEGLSDMPDGTTAISQMTLGWNPTKQRYEGTWIGSMMAWLWVYDGEVDASGRRLSLYSRGPSMSDDGTIAEYKDVVEFTSDDSRTLTGHTKAADGTWQPFMQVEYHRVAPART